MTGNSCQCVLADDQEKKEWRVVLKPGERLHVKGHFYSINATEGSFSVFSAHPGQVSRVIHQDEDGVYRSINFFVVASDSGCRARFTRVPVTFQNREAA